MRRLGECALLAVLFAVPLSTLNAADRVNNGEETDPGPLPPLPPVPGGETPAPTPAPTAIAAPVVTAPAPVSVTPVAAPAPVEERKPFSTVRTTKEEVFTPGGNEKKDPPKGDLTGDIPLPPPAPNNTKPRENPPVVHTGPIETLPNAPTPAQVAKMTPKRIDDTPAPSISKGVPLQTSASLIDDKPAVVLPAASENAAPGGDLLADRPGTIPEAKRGAFYMEMADFTAPEWGGPEVRKTYKYVAEMKQFVYQISLDLDNGGMEITRLKFNTESLQKSITDVTLLWEENGKFKDRGMATKRTALVLEEELGNEPRKWSHVRWAFRELQTQVRDLRLAAVDVADASPRPTRYIDKNGKEVVVAPEKDPLLLAREAEARKIADLKKEKERLKKRSGESKEDPLQEGRKIDATGTPYLKPRD